MITLSFDIVDPFPVLSTHELISESGINDQDIIGLSLLFHQHHLYEELQIQVANYESAIKLVAMFDGIKPTHVTPEDIEVHQVS